MEQNVPDLFGSHIKKSYRVYMTAVLVLTLIELAFAVRGLMVFNLERQKHRMYLYAYLFLFASSFVTFLVLAICRGREKYMRHVMRLTYGYAFCLICWSTMVSTIDCVSKGDSGPMVYVMVCFAVGTLFLIKPVWYISMVGIGAAMLVFCCYQLSGEPFSGGFYINFLVFLGQAIFMNIHHYRINRREFEASRQLTVLSITDQLTGLYNRRHLDAQIGAWVERGADGLFLLIDVDNFKDVNDSHGHAVGDICLRLIAERLRAAFGDRVYRFGGDEFAVITQADETVVCAALEQINAGMKDAHRGIDLHISTGIYRMTEDDTAGTIFIRTDRALYQAKADGKGRYAIFDGERV